MAASFDEVAAVLRAASFIQDNILVASQRNALFIKKVAQRMIPVTVPTDCDPIPNSVIRQIMETAGIPEGDYASLL